MSRVDRQQLRNWANARPKSRWRSIVVNSSIYLLDRRVRLINKLVAKGWIKRPQTPLYLVEQQQLAKPVVGIPSVVIIAEVSIPQCYFYRVEQRAAQFESLGYRVHIVKWNDTYEALANIYVANVVWFYRTPFFAGVEAMYKRARLLKKPTFFDVDDLIFNRSILQEHFKAERKQLGESEYQGLLQGADLYLSAMLAADYVIASTASLARSMENVGAVAPKVLVNGLSREEVRIPTPASERVNIIYGSGTNTHNRDFNVIVPALIEVLNQNPRAHLHLVGELSVSEKLSQLSDRVTIHPLMSFNDYQKLLCRCHITLAPLEVGEFADAKSEIKWLEASLAGLASVVTRTRTYDACIEQGITGYKCNSVAHWREALTQLVEDDQARIEMVLAAQRYILQHYGHSALSHRLQHILKPTQLAMPSYTSSVKADDAQAEIVVSLRRETTPKKPVQWQLEPRDSGVHYRLFAAQKDSDSWVKELEKYLQIEVVEGDESVLDV